MKALVVVFEYYAKKFPNASNFVCISLLLMFGAGAHEKGQLYYLIGFVFVWHFALFLMERDADKINPVPKEFRK